MKNLNIYTLRELIKMYIDEKPMPDVAFVTQTDAMKLQSTLKEETMSEWITDRLPTREDGSNGHLVYDYRGEPAMYYNIRVGEAWKPIPKCDPYVKPKRYTIVRFDNAEWGVLRIADYEYVAHSIAWNAREAAEEIEAIFERLMP